jgi:heme/copper-type cytochrome/quinol oxidase subunit 2
MKRLLAILIVTIGAVALCGPAPESRRRPQGQISVTARRYAFEPARIEARQGDVIRLTIRTEDIPHSFVIDALRIEKRAVPGRPVTFELLADKAGTFPFYCNLTAEEGCRGMKGELIIR